MRGWWPFLIMSMVSYALLPRLLLWLCSRLFYPPDPGGVCGDARQRTGAGPDEGTGGDNPGTGEGRTREWTEVTPR